MTELFRKITKEDLSKIGPAVQQILQILYDELGLTRLNLVRTLIIALSNSLSEWSEAEAEILKGTIKDKKELEQNLIDRHVAQHIAAILLLIDGSDLPDINQKKLIIKQLSKMIKKVEKKIIL